MEQELTIMEIEQVAGGTVDEMEELVRSLSKASLFRAISAIECRVPGNNEKVGEMMRSLLRGMKIDARIKLGLGGTGLFAGPNEYISAEDGRKMTHAEVLRRIAASQK